MNVDFEVVACDDDVLHWYWRPGRGLHLGRVGCTLVPTLAHWLTGTLWHTGTLVHWHTGANWTLVHCGTDALPVQHWYTVCTLHSGNRALMHTGTRMHTGSLMYCGTLVHWYTGTGTGTLVPTAFPSDTLHCPTFLHCANLLHCTMCTLYSTIPQCPMYPESVTDQPTYQPTSDMGRCLRHLRVINV